MGSPEVARGFLTGTGCSLALAVALSSTVLPIVTPLMAAVINSRRFIALPPAFSRISVLGLLNGAIIARWVYCCLKSKDNSVDNFSFGIAVRYWRNGIMPTRAKLMAEALKCRRVYDKC
jgi:hypothetical protein